MNKKPFLYRFGLFLLGNIFRLYYNPKIIGKENIPEQGSIVIAGNHVHLYDQCHVLISTKRFINYMAKREYFDSCKTRWFFKGVGCIPVDRSKKDGSAMESAINVLKSGGSIGIYPEGTRNALKNTDVLRLYNKYFKEYDFECFKKKIKQNKPKKSQILFMEGLYCDKKISQEYFYNSFANVDRALKKLIGDVISVDEYYNSLLLPFKYGAVSLAKKTNSKIIPIAVTGDYKFRSNNLIIKIGAGLDVTNMELADANEVLRMKIIDMMKDSENDF